MLLGLYNDLNRLTGGLMTNLESVIERIEKARLAYDSKAIIKLVAWEVSM